MCKDDRRKISGYCSCLGTEKICSVEQRRLIEEYIAVFKSYLRKGPDSSVRQFEKQDLLVLLNFFVLQGNAVRFNNECELALQ